MTSAEFVHRARLDAARRLLEDTSAPLKRIARDSGFGSVEAMRRAFLKSIGVGPADYRGRFGHR
jgi:transcriptional regulator GlxA family with amidase domain